MPETSASLFGLENKDPAELEQRRRQIVEELQRFPGSWEDPNVPIPLLQELSHVVAMLKRRNSGPPKKAAPKRLGKTATVDDLLGMISGEI